MFNSKTFIGSLLATAACAQIDITGPISISSEQTIVDSEGRQLIMHGVNAVYKVDPYIPSNGTFSATDSMNAEDI